jgi:surface carbohydrate biosynthesis protein
MLVMSNAIGAEYNKFISGKTLVIGSFKNNYIKKSNPKVENKLSFISQYRSNFGNWKENGVPVKWEEFFNAEKYLLSLLKSFCNINNLRLNIISVSNRLDSNEHIFYKKLLGSETEWDFSLNNSYYSSYNQIDTSLMVVAIESTLGYEAFARGLKVGFFPIRNFSGIKNPYPFGWPDTLNEDGPFWTNKRDHKKISIILNNILNTTNEDWQKIKINI